MNVTAQKFQSQNGLVCKSLAWNNHRTTLPQSRPVGRDSSLREGVGRGLHHSSGYSLKSGVAGDFHRPYEGSEYSAAQKNPPVSAGGAIPGGAGHLPYRNPLGA